MKKVFSIVLVFGILASCNNAKTDSAKTASDTSTAKLDYPYTIEHPDSWQIGDSKNSVVALKALKAYENGNIDECVSYFGDSIQLAFDEYEQKVSRDSLKAWFTRSRGASKSMKIKMDDWESVISPDKKFEYVSLWYKQIWEDQKGKTDSASIMDDVRMKDGKIISLDEKSRKYAVKKI